MHFQQISQTDAKQVIASLNPAVLDIRDAAAFAAGHIDGAQALNNENLKHVTDGLEFTTPIIVYCYHGNSSQSAAQFLVDQGFEEVYSLMGGYTAWSAGQ